MPCMGPDCEAARKRGAEVASELLMMLKEKHDILPSDVERPCHTPFQQQKLAAEIAFIKAVEELFVVEACESF